MKKENISQASKLLCRLEQLEKLLSRILASSFNLSIDGLLELTSESSQQIRNIYTAELTVEIADLNKKIQAL